MTMNRIDLGHKRTTFKKTPKSLYGNRDLYQRNTSYGQNAVTKSQERRCLLRYLLAQNLLQGHEHKALIWYKKWTHRCQKDIDAPKVKSQSFEARSKTGTYGRALSLSAIQSLEKEREQGLVSFRQQRRVLQEKMPSLVSFLDKMIERDDGIGLTSTDLFQDLCPDQKEKVVVCLKTVAKGIQDSVSSAFYQ